MRNIRNFYTNVLFISKMFEFNLIHIIRMISFLAPVQTTDPGTACIYDDGEYHNEYCIYDGEDYVGHDAGYDYDIYGGEDDGYHGMYCDDANGYHGNRQRLNASTNSEPGDYYDYGWDYESAAGSEQQTPLTPSYHYQQQQHLEKRRRRGGRPVRYTINIVNTNTMY